MEYEQRMGHMSIKRIKEIYNVCCTMILNNYVAWNLSQLLCFFFLFFIANFTDSGLDKILVEVLVDVQLFRKSNCASSPRTIDDRDEDFEEAEPLP